MIEFIIGTLLGFGIGVFFMAIFQIVGESYERYDILDSPHVIRVYHDNVNGDERE